MSVSSLKHEVFSILFKIRTSLEILREERDHELLEIAYENTALLEKILKRVFILQSLIEGKHSVKREEINPVTTIGNILGIELSGDERVETDPYLFEEGIKAIKDSFVGKPSVTCGKRLVVLEGKIKEDGIAGFFLDFAGTALESAGIKLEDGNHKIELSWEGSS